MSTSSRLLRLLSLLQTPRDWTGSELAQRLEVSPRTVRNDIERLRDLGYPVHATRGSIGGYRLDAGTSMPPLLLEDDEAVAVAIAMRTATGGAVEGLEESSLRALAKLEQVLPPRLRRQVQSVQSVTMQVRRYRPAQTVDPAVLTRARAPRPRAVHGPVRLLRPQAGVDPAARRAVPDRQRRPALVPGGVGPGSGGLADVPRGPDAPRDLSRDALHLAPPDRRGGRGAGRPRASRRRRASSRRGSSFTCRRSDWRSGSGRGSGRWNRSMTNAASWSRARSGWRTSRSTSGCSARTSGSRSRRSWSRRCGCWQPGSPTRLARGTSHPAIPPNMKRPGRGTRPGLIC